MENKQLVLQRCSEADLLKLIEGDEAFKIETGLQVVSGYLEYPEALLFSLAKIREVPEKEKSWWSPYLFILPAANAVVGFGGYKGPPQDGTVELGYCVAPEYRGRGLATEAAIALAENVAVLPEVQRVWAHTLAENNASTRVLTKAGFVKIEEVVDPDDGPAWRWERSAAGSAGL